MRTFRHFLRRNAVAAWVLVAVALAMKVAVPGGFMPMMTTNGLAIVLCPGMAPTSGSGSAVAAPAPMAMPEMAMSGMADHAVAGHPKGSGDAPAKPDAPCAFAGLTAPTLGGTDALVLAIAIAAIVAAGLFFRPTAPLIRRTFLRPQLRGPPARA